MKIIFRLLSLAILFSSCAPQFRVNVSSYGNETFSDDKNYMLVPSDSTIYVYSLEFQEYTNYLKRVLKSRGYYYVEDPKVTNVVIFINYGISDPVTYEKLVSKPVRGKTGVSSTTTTGNAYVNPYSNTITYSQKTQNNPSYGVIGYRSYTKTETYYLRFLHLTAFDFDYFTEYGEQKTIWETEVTSTGSSGDLRKVFPILVGASANYFGKNSGEKIEIRLYENDSRVIEVKGIN